MIKINSDFAHESSKYFDEMTDLFAMIPTGVTVNRSSDMIRDLSSINDEENVKYSDSIVLSSTNIGNGTYFKSKRSVVHE